MLYYNSENYVTDNLSLGLFVKFRRLSTLVFLLISGDIYLWNLKALKAGAAASLVSVASRERIISEVPSCLNTLFVPSTEFLMARLVKISS